MKRRYVVAVSPKEAERLVADFGWDQEEDALAHLADVQAPPTDPFYARMYKVFTVDIPIVPGGGLR